MQIVWISHGFVSYLSCNSNIKCETELNVYDAYYQL